MGINLVHQAFVDEKEIIAAAGKELESRKARYQALVDAGKGEAEWVEKCDQLIEQFKKQQGA